MARAMNGSPDLLAALIPALSSRAGRGWDPRSGRVRGNRSPGVGWSGRLALLDAVPTRWAVRREAVLGERLLDAVIKHADLADAARLFAAGDLTTEFAGNAHELLDLPHRAHLAPAILRPEIVFDAAADMQPHGDRHHVDRQHVAHRAFERQDRAVRRGPHEIGEIVDVGCIHAAADRDPVHDQRALVDAAAHHSFDGFEAVDVVELEGALNARRGQPPDVFFDPAGPR